ncbi:MAG: hypothetical protein S4CHLAM20_08070 [Chlamydiia bacterium]|nr:hypothetical protein [Chlamydiia bacterium]
MKRLSFLIKCFSYVMIAFSMPMIIANPYTHRMSSLGVPQDLNYKLGLTYDDIITFMERVERGDYDLSFTYQDKQKAIQLITFLANQGKLPDVSDEILMDNEITYLLDCKENPLEIAFKQRDFQSYYSITADLFSKSSSQLRPCGWLSDAWKKTKQFVQKYKKEIIIGITVVGGTLLVGGIATSVSGASALAIANGDTPSDRNISKPNPDSDVKKANINQGISNPSINEVYSNLIVTPDKIKEEMYDLLDDYLLNFKKEKAKNCSFIDQLMSGTTSLINNRDYDAYAAHVLVELIAARLSLIPLVGDIALNSFNKYLPNMSLDPLIDKYGGLLSNYEKGALTLHELIDDFYSTKQAHSFSPDAKSQNWVNWNDLLILIDAKNMIQRFPRFFKDIPEVLKRVKDKGSSSYTTLLKDLKSLSKKDLKSISWETAKAKSNKIFHKAQKYLDKFKTKVEGDKLVRMHIMKTGIPVYPRPKGIPKDYLVKITDTGAGMKYINPKNSNFSIRIMPGKIHSKYRHQRRPYVIHMKHGKTIDKFGNVVNKKTPEAHIPLEEFVYE